MDRKGSFSSVGVFKDFSEYDPNSDRAHSPLKIPFPVRSL
jgi:hypothetical protein